MAPLKIAKRGDVPPFQALEMLALANACMRRGDHIVHMEVGQPATPAPAAALLAARQAMDSNPIGYTEAFGLPELRERIARHYAECYQHHVTPGQIAVTTGSSAGFLLAFLAAFDVGDRLALAAPAYPAYRVLLKALGIEAIEIPTDAKTRFQLTPEILEQIGGPIHGLLIASPANPTGSMLSKEELAALAAYCRARSIRLVSDEIYHGIHYGEAPHTAMAFNSKAIVINGFSKYFSMTGWRLGWMVVPDDLLRPVESLAQSLYISPPTLSQFAGKAALDCRVELDGHVAIYRRNRDLLLEALPSLGIRDWAPADGGFYLYADISPISNDSVAFCEAALKEAGVAMTPGTDFDSGRGCHFVRLSYAGAPKDIALAIDRLKAWRKISS